MSADARDRWLVTLGGQFVRPDATDIDPATARLLDDVAAYRHRWGITGPDPFGDGAVDSDQVAETALLTTAINHAADAVLDVPESERPDRRPLQMPLPALDDPLGS